MNEWLKEQINLTDPSGAQPWKIPHFVIFAWSMGEN